jgi:hypothetical protein
MGAHPANHGLRHNHESYMREVVLSAAIEVGKEAHKEQRLG